MKIKNTPYYNTLVKNKNLKLKAEKQLSTNPEDNSFPETISDSEIRDTENDVVIEYAKHSKIINSLEDRLVVLQKSTSNSMSAHPLDYEVIKRCMMAEKTCEANIKLAYQAKEIIFGITSSSDETLELS